MKFSKLKMTESLFTHGLIYFSGSENPIGGLLEYNDNLIHLTFVIDNFSLELERLSEVVKNVTFITSSGERLYLKKGLCTNSQHSSANITTFDIEYHYLILDINYGLFTDSNEDKFNSFLIYCSYFKEIFTNSPFTYKRYKDDQLDTQIELNLESTLGVCILKNRMEITDLIFAKQYNRGEGFDLKYDYTPFLEFKFSNRQSFDDMISKAMEIRNLFSFITEHNIKVEELYITENNKSYKIFWANEFDIKLKKPSHQLVNQVKPFLKRRFGEIISGYFNNEKNLDDVLPTYVNNIYRTIYVDDYLLSHIIIMEGLHRRFICNKKKNLFVRLDELFNYLDRTILNQIFSNVELNNDLIKFLVDFRNYYSHLFDIMEKPQIDFDKIELAKLLRKVIKEFIYLKINVEESFVLLEPRQYEFRSWND